MALRLAQTLRWSERAPHDFQPSQRAWLAEAAYFSWPYQARRALFASLIANDASFVLGMISRKLFGFP
jgi:hypothetical protein